MGKKLIVKLPQILEREGISLRELGRRTDIRHAALSEFSNLKRSTININHLLAIAEELNIKSISEIIEIVDEKETE
jgi:putative transcriptional regulator